MNNYIQLELGGELRGLKFNVGTLSAMQDHLDIDPLTFKAESSSWKDLLPYATKIVYAALVSNCKSKKTEPNFTLEQVEEWVNDLTGAQLTQVVDMWNKQFIIEQSANGEAGKEVKPVTFQ